MSVASSLNMDCLCIQASEVLSRLLMSKANRAVALSSVFSSGCPLKLATTMAFFGIAVMSINSLSGPDDREARYYLQERE